MTQTAERKVVYLQEILNDPVRHAKQKESKRKWYIKNRANNPQQEREYFIYRTYSLSWDDYLAIYTEQHEACAICPTKIALYKNNEGIPVPHVDHDHTTGRVRGLLCRLCNVGVGHFRDHPELLRNAANYLEKGKT